MKAKQHFSFDRFLLLCRQSWIINKRQIGISVAGLTGIMVLMLLFAQSNHMFKNWGNDSYMGIFTTLFFTIGILFASSAFPAFRSKVRTIPYLMQPATGTEKFVFELLVRVFGLIIFMPALYWLVANLEGSIVHTFVPAFDHYRFSFTEAYHNLVTENKVEFMVEMLFIQGILFLFIGFFTGASFFTKAPLLKTILLFSIILAGYSLFFYLLFKGFDLNKYHPAGDRVLFINSKESALLAFTLFAAIVNISLLTIAWFQLKEKEV